MQNKSFQIYLSGIVYGKVFFEDNQVFYEKLNAQTGEMQVKTELTKEENIQYQNWLKIDLLTLAAKIDLYEEFLCTEKKESVTLPNGERYSFWASDNPYAMDIWVQRDKKFPVDVLVKDGMVIGFVVTWREGTTVLIAEGEECDIISQWDERNKQGLYCVKEVQTVMVPMKDGVRLATDLYLPANMLEKPPVLLVRTPYGRQDGAEGYWRYVQRGYAVVIQDVRGRNDSEGLWEPCSNEIEDGNDTLNWIAAQDWNNGRIGMIGGSYLGFVQWAAAASGNSHLKAIVSIVTSGSPFVDIPRRGGTFVSGMLAWAFAMSQKRFAPQYMIRDDWETILDIRPLESITRKALGYPVPFIDTWLKNYDYNDMWDQMNWAARKENIHVPALVLSGWYDDNSMGTTEALDIIQKYPEGQRKVILGPWVHSGNACRDIHGVSFGNNSLRYDIDLNYLKWLDYHLMGIENGINKSSPVEYYSVGDNQWRTAQNWPLKENEVELKKIYLDKEGQLVWELPKEEAKIQYEYDPANPAPHLIDVSENEIGVPADYSEVEQRDDVLTFTSKTFEKEETLTGDMDITFWASSDAVDTDWIVRVMDVDEKGHSIKLADGILSARYREGFHKPVFMDSDVVYPFHIRTTKISNTFLKGHRIRFSITSSAKNFVFPNSNTKEGYNSVNYVKAKHTIYSGGRYPSYLTLPLEKK